MKNIALLFLLAAGGLCAQFPNVLIEKHSGRGYAPCEPSIAIHPEDPNLIMAGAILDKSFFSTDGGRTWSISRFQSRFGVFGDPCIIAGPKKRFYAFHLSNPSGKGWEDEHLLDRIVAQRSNKAKPNRDGLKWSRGSGIGLNHPKDQDKEWACFDPARDRIYTTWTQFDRYDSPDPKDESNILFSTAGKRAVNWSTPIQINEIAGNCLDDDLTTEGAVPAVDAEGNIYVTWALGDTLYFDRSFDGGVSWMDKDYRIANIAGGWAMDIPGINRCNGMPVTFCDMSSGPYAGTIYVNWADQRNGVDDTDIWLVYSRDKGATWSEPIRVNQDEGKAHQFFTWMTADPTNGHLYAVYYDRRNHSPQGLKTDVYLARSVDGGQTWEDFLVSEKPFVPKEGLFFGDYNALSAVDGHIRPIWTAIEGGVHHVYTALIEETDF